MKIAGFCHLFLLAISIAAAEKCLLGDDSPQQLNIVLIVADDLRADVMSVYGGPVDTPNLTNLAQRGALFKRAICGYPICHVSRSEILTGRCLVAEAASGLQISFQESWALWPDVMKRAGWRTVHMGKWHVSGTPARCGYVDASAMYSGDGASVGPLTLPKSATNRDVTGYVGWTFKDPNNRPIHELGIGLTPLTDANIADAAVTSIQNKGRQPLFLHVNLTAPHDPLHWPESFKDRYPASEIVLPANFQQQHPFDHGNLHGRDELIVPAPRTAHEVRRERAVYYSLVENLDAQIGKILQAIDQSSTPKNWLIIFTSDQGLALGSHGLMGKQNQYEHTINVPLIVVGPGVWEGRQIENQCALRDLFPTVCDLAGLPRPESVQGTSLFPLLKGKTRSSTESVYGYFTQTQRMIRSSDGWKLISYPKADRIQLFHVASDRDELLDLSGDPSQRRRIQQMSRQLNEWLRSRGDMAILTKE